MVASWQPLTLAQALLGSELEAQARTEQGRGFEAHHLLLVL